jgi:U1 small nuclear ribonucleoprotein
MKIMFEARAPLDFLPPSKRRNKQPITGVGSLVSLVRFGTPRPTFQMETTPAPPVQRFETPLERRARKRNERVAVNKEKLAAAIEEYKPLQNASATRNAFNTMFVGRLAYETDEAKLRREFDTYGPITKVVLVRTPQGSSRGYAFIEFEREDDMLRAVRSANGRKIDGHRVITDVERGRTVRNWRPRRLGGGIGDSRPPK